MCALVIIINIYIVYYCMITCKVYWPTTFKSKVGCVFPNSTWSIKEMIIVKTQPTLFVLPQIDLKLPGISKPSLSPNRHKPSLFGISLISFSSFNSIPRLSRNRICLINLNEQKSRFFTSNNWLRTKYIPDANIIKRSHRFWAQRIWPKYRLVIGHTGLGLVKTNRWYNTDCGFTSVEPCR